MSRLRFRFGFARRIFSNLSFSLSPLSNTSAVLLLRRNFHDVSRGRAVEHASVHFAVRAERG